MAPLLTNELLEKLEGAIGALNDAVHRAEILGIPIAPNVPFFRMGEPIRLPVSPTSGSDRFDLTGANKIPPNVTTFMVWNNNPFPCRLRGTREGQTFQAVTPTTGWVLWPGSNGPFTTLSPIALATLSIDGPFAASDTAQKAGVGWLELQYGTGV